MHVYTYLEIRAKSTKFLFENWLNYEYNTRAAEVRRSTFEMTQIWRLEDVLLHFLCGSVVNRFQGYHEQFSRMQWWKIHIDCTVIFSYFALIISLTKDGWIIPKCKLYSENAELFWTNERLIKKYLKSILIK